MWLKSNYTKCPLVKYQCENIGEQNKELIDHMILTYFFSVGFSNAQFQALISCSKSFYQSEPVWPDWTIYWTLGNFLKPLSTIKLPKSPTFLGNFVKVLKSFIFLVKSFLGIFYRHLEIFFWSHWSEHTNPAWRKFTHYPIICIGQFLQKIVQKRKLSPKCHWKRANLYLLSRFKSFFRTKSTSDIDKVAIQRKDAELE